MNPRKSKSPELQEWENEGGAVRPPQISEPKVPSPTEKMESFLGNPAGLLLIAGVGILLIALILTLSLAGK